MQEPVGRLIYQEAVRNALIARMRCTTDQQAISKYEAELFGKFDALLPFLSSIQFNSVFDIGCGFAGMDILIAQQFGTDTFHLLDGDGQYTKCTGYSAAATQPWNDVALSRLHLKTNVPAAFVRTYQPHYTFDLTMDLVISLRSWGHHYPVITYLGIVQRCLSLGGHLVLDIRERTDGARMLQQNGFELVQEIPEPSKKCRRLAFRKVR